MANTTDQTTTTNAAACCAGCAAEAAQAADPVIVEDVDYSDLDDATPQWVPLPAN